MNLKSRVGQCRGGGLRQEHDRKGGSAKGGADIVGVAQGGRRNGQAGNGAAELEKRPGQVSVPAESRVDVSSHGLWKWGTTAMFDIRIVDLDTVSYLCMTPKKALAKANKDKKDLYLQACLEHRRSSTPKVYFMDIIIGAEALSTQKMLGAILSFNMKQE